METKKPPFIRFTLGRQSSGAPENDAVFPTATSSQSLEESMDSGIRLMYSANEGDLQGVIDLLETSPASVNFRDIDSRTALHVASCQGLTEVVELLIRRGADVDAEDRWGSTPLADAIYYKHNDVIKILEAHGAKPAMAPMHVENVREVPEYEIDPTELDFTHSVDITKGTFCIASWRGIQAFRDELALLQKIRHPNVVQFLGAVTQSTPMMIVTEYLPKGDFCAYLKKKGALKLATAIKFALDIARGMNYLHENKPEAIIHRDLEPSNILRDDSGHLKVADFGISKLMKVAKTIKEDKSTSCQQTSWRYAAPEVFRHEEYDTKVDVFSFALILHEMIEGCPPFPTRQDIGVAKAYVANERPPFNAPVKHYAYGLRQLIESCWDEKPSKRPTFREIILKLDEINNRLRKRKWKVKALKYLHKFESILKLDRSNAGSASSRSIVR